MRAVSSPVLTRLAATSWWSSSSSSSGSSPTTCGPGRPATADGAGPCTVAREGPVMLRSMLPPNGRLDGARGNPQRRHAYALIPPSAPVRTIAALPEAPGWHRWTGAAWCPHAPFSTRSTTEGKGMQPEPNTPAPAIDAGPIALMAFALSTFILSAINAQIVDKPAIWGAIASAWFMGGGIQLLIGVYQLVKGKLFSAMAFLAYGAFWLSFALYEASYVVKIENPAD